MNSKVTVTNIQRFSLHDGPGIRTTVFLKGCILHCPWCSNPENIAFEIEPYSIGGESRVYGREMSLFEIYDECMKDRAYYEDGGGVTFSGGEPLVQIEKIASLLERLKADKVSLCAETSLFATSDNVKTSIKYFDSYCVDIKILDDMECNSLLGGDLDLYRRNVRLLLSEAIDRNIVFRFPLIAPYTVSEKNIRCIAIFCREHGIKKLEVIKGHNLAEKKYRTLGKEMYFVPEFSDEKISVIQRIFDENGVSTVLCRI